MRVPTAMGSVPWVRAFQAPSGARVSRRAAPVGRCFITAVTVVMVGQMMRICPSGFWVDSRWASWAASADSSMRGARMMRRRFSFGLRPWMGMVGVTGVGGWVGSGGWLRVFGLVGARRFMTFKGSVKWCFAMLWAKWRSWGVARG